MTNWVENIKQQTALRLLLVIGLALAALGGSWWLIDKLMADSQALAAGLKAAVLILIAAISAAMAATVAVKPAREISAALEHVSAEGGDEPAPEVTAGAAQAVEQIYQLASSAAKLTDNIDESQLFLTAAIDMLPVGILIFDTEQNLKFINKTASGLLKHDAKELIGLPKAKVLDWNFQTDETYDVWLDQSRGHKIKDTRFWERVSIILTDNKRIIGDIAVAYEKNNTSDIETVVAFIDKTAQYMADEAQLDFVSVAAHELRGPITVIRGYLDVFNEEMSKVFNVEQRSLLQKMTVNAEMLSLYVNNILNVARLDQQELKLHVVKADWREIMKEAYAELFLRAQARGRVLKLEMPQSISPVAVDRVSVLEVINNLVDNAIKYSDEGGEIIIEIKEHDGQIATTVQDFGIGIPSGVIGNLFKKFYRSHRTRRGVSGTGLGLYLSKAIVDAHGGNIWVRSKEGQGSTFGFDLPTYDTVADTLKAGDNQGDSIKRSSQGWIKNHAMTRR
ncbi:MAG TPA: ATP-binding protein [Candidatus Saccharimonadales bacterium]